MKKIIFLSLLFFCSSLWAQKTDNINYFTRPNRDGRTGQFTFFWGYNRGYFTKSDIHVHGPDYEFTVYDAVAHDRATPFGDESYYNPALFTIPQFNCRIGYEINSKWAVSVGWDHMKYVMDDGQTAEISGVIADPVNTKYNGIYLRKPTVLSEDLFKFEHTDGLNVVSIDVERRFKLWSSRKDLFSFHSITGAGTGIVVPRSDVRVVGSGLNNNWHISGYHVNVKTGIRFEFLRNGFLQIESRTGYINLPNVLIQNDRAHRIDHHFFFLEWYGALGIYMKIL